MRIKVDAGHTHLALCPCGWRGLPQRDHVAALREGRHHELRAHPGDKDALRALNNALSRRQ